MSEFKTECKNCNKEIYMFLSKNGKYYPTNTDKANDFHKCKKEPEEEFNKASEVVDEVRKKTRDMYEQSLADILEIIDKRATDFSNEDIRTMTNTLYMSRDRRS